MGELKYGDINDDALRAMQKPHLPYLIAITLLAVMVGCAAVVWAFQMLVGMGVTGLNHPVGWATYIGNFVFWVGIAHSGTLISAILYLLRARWRNAVSRSSEAMTIFAVMTAGLFPLIHLGRTWVFYYILPYPSQRQIWPNFISPLIWDVCAVGTYFTVSLIFWYVGLIPDLAAARDRFEITHGDDAFRTRLYRTLALGWSGTGTQWRHYGRAYLYFAALATPLVISVHSVVSWDFAMSLLPGWHSTIFPPYFVAGAIHSGLAMVLTLMIPMRKLLRLERLIELHHFEMVARTIIVTAAIVGYSYAVEPFIAWYSGDQFEWQFYRWRMFGSAASWIYWLLIPLNVLIPLLFSFRRFRSSFAWLFIISLLINVGMWLERLFIVYTSVAHDFLPHNWGTYSISWTEAAITVGSFAFFFFFFFVFSKTLPTVPVSDLKERIADEEIEPCAQCQTAVQAKIDPRHGAVLAIFSNAGRLVQGTKATCDGGFLAMESFSPVRVEEVHTVMGHPKSPVRFWTLAGALLGLAGGFWLAIGTATVNGLVVGGKAPVSPIPYCVVAFEGTILVGSLVNLAAMLFHARLFRPGTVPFYDRRFSRDRFGLLVRCTGAEADLVQKLLLPAQPEEIHVYR